MIRYIFLLMPLWAYAQDSRWRIVVERDSLAIGPLSDVRKWAGLRVAKNDMARQCAWELANLNRQVGSLRAALESSERAIDKKEEVIVAMRANADTLQATAKKWHKKAKRRNPIIMIGLGLVSGVLITTALQ